MCLEPVIGGSLQGARQGRCASIPLKGGMSFTGEVSEWLKEHAWKVCVR